MKSKYAPRKASVWDKYEDEQKRVNQRRGRGEGSDHLAARTAWFLRPRSDAEGHVLHGVYAKAAAHRRRLELEQSKTAGAPGAPGSVNWTPLGPSVIEAGPWTESGRINAIAVGPGGTRIYAAAVNGGVWSSPDGGASWSPLDDYTMSPSVSRPGYVGLNFLRGARGT